MTDIVERLRVYARNCGGPPEEYLTWWAADEIERLRAALQSIADRERPSTARSMARRALEPKP